MHHPKSSLLLLPLIPPLPSSTSLHPLFPLVITKLLSVCMNFFCLISHLFTQPPTTLPSDSCQSVLSIYETVSEAVMKMNHHLSFSFNLNCHLSVPYIRLFRPVPIWLNLKVERQEVFVSRKYNKLKALPLISTLFFWSMFVYSE